MIFHAATPPEPREREALLSPTSSERGSPLKVISMCLLAGPTRCNRSLPRRDLRLVRKEHHRAIVCPLPWATPQKASRGRRRGLRLAVCKPWGWVGAFHAVPATPEAGNAALGCGGAFHLTP